MKLPPVLRAAIVALALLSPAAAAPVLSPVKQTIHSLRDPVQSDTRLGASVAVDPEPLFGVPQSIVGVPGQDIDGIADAGAVKVFGTDGGDPQNRGYLRSIFKKLHRAERWQAARGSACL
jgi:hypothetical protein